MSDDQTRWDIRKANQKAYDAWLAAQAPPGMTIDQQAHEAALRSAEALHPAQTPELPDPIDEQADDYQLGIQDHNLDGEDRDAHDFSQVEWV